MDIKHGDIITLDNGDTVKVSLKVISKKVTELVSGKSYFLKRSGQFCHAKDTKGEDFGDELSNLEFQYVGRVEAKGGDRFIFFSKNDTIYSMWGVDNLDFVVREV
jgi:hypothetical protein